MKVYHGCREGQVTEVTVNGTPLNPRLDLWNHSPTGFEWGYAGSGPAQLALALLADHLGNPEQAIDLHQEFKQRVVATLPYTAWQLTSEQIAAILERLTTSRSQNIPIAVVRLGTIVSTPNALAHISNADILTAIQRHQAGDWGEVNEHDFEANNRALVEGARLLSIYHARHGVKFWIITEADRSVTTVLLPEDY